MDPDGGRDAQTIALMSSPSSLQYSGTSAAYDMNASTSGSATFARPSWSSTSDVGSSVTGCSVDVDAAGADGSLRCPGFGVASPTKSGVVNAITLALPAEFVASGSAKAKLVITDADYKSERYGVSVDGAYVGTTGEFVSDPKKYCDTKKAEQCIQVRWGLCFGVLCSLVLASARESEPVPGARCRRR